MILNDEGRYNLLWCMIGFGVGLLIGTAVTFSNMQDELYSKDRSRNGLWHEAIMRGHAEQIETADGKPAYRWREE